MFGIVHISFLRKEKLHGKLEILGKTDSAFLIDINYDIY